MPKIWGNTRLHHRTALLGIWLGTACTTPAPELVPRAIQTGWLPQCKPTDTSTGQLDLDALGDFDPSTETHAVTGIHAADSFLAIPDSTHAVVVDADTRFGHFRGVGSVPDSGDIPVALWPAGKSCDVFQAEKDSFPADVAGLAIGYAESESLLLIAGGQKTSALTVDLSTGKVQPPRVGPRTARIGATVTPFGGMLLVAGGTDTEDGTPIASADVFDPKGRSFELTPLALSRPRADHAAVVLPSGETLLVGGRDAEVAALRALEAVSPDGRSYRLNDLTSLSVGRAKPVALTLSDGRILVAGGFDSAGAPLETVEWLSPDALHVEQQSTLRPDAGVLPTGDRAFVAMPGGSALAVGGCRVTDTTRDCTPCASGAGCASRDVIWITPSGVPEPLPDALDVSLRPELLVAGTEGRPWLIANSPDGRALLRFDPWLGRFTVPDDVPVPPLAGFTEPPGSAFEARAFAVEPGLFLWISRPAPASPDDSQPPGLFGFRHDTRGAYTSAVIPLLFQDRNGVSLDRPNRGTSAGLDPESGEVVLTADSGNVLVVTDTTYADVGVSLEVSDGPPPVVLLGDHVYGDDDCHWPDGPLDGVTARLERVGNDVKLVVGKKSVTCPGPDGRVSIWLKGPRPAVRVRSIGVTRNL